MGQLLGVAMATTQASSVRADLAAVSVRESLAGAELLTSPADVRNAPLVLIVLPPGQEGAESSLATRTVLSGLVSGIGHNAAGVVVVGDEDSADGRRARRTPRERADRADLDRRRHRDHHRPGDRGARDAGRDLGNDRFLRCVGI